MATDLAAALPAPLRDLRSLKNVPVLRQLTMLGGLALAIAAGIALFSWSQKPNLTPLYANLGDKDSSEIADALRTAGVDYRLDAASGAVMVPADKVHEARLRLASQGLPKGTALGMEMIQQEQGFGTSQFIETARYQLALETELARTVSSLTPVKAARVHLALPKPSAFMRANDGASASVLVELHPGRQLEPSQVASIVHVVASSVPNLATSAVTVVDQYGHLLTQTRSDGSDTSESTEQFDYARRVEADYVRRIEQLLTPMMGAGRISAQVAADLDFSVTEEAREAFNPNPQAIRSEQTSEDMARNGAAAGGAGSAVGGQAQGIPGATSNQPPTAAAAQPLNPPAAVAAAGQAAPVAAGATEPTSQSRTATRNFELDKTISHTRQAAGRVRRLSVAVLVDQLPKTDAQGNTVPTALTAEELARVETLVREAVGFDAKRGDSVAVQNAAFITPEAATPPAALPLWQQPEARDYARQGLGAAVLLVLGLFVLRPMLRNLLAPPPKTVEGVLETMNGHRATAALRDGSVSDGEAAGTPRIYEQKLVVARAAVAQDPKRVAQVVKTWIGADA
jgi:flagellar M-ring protein FliF